MWLFFYTASDPNVASFRLHAVSSALLPSTAGRWVVSSFPKPESFAAAGITGAPRRPRAPFTVIAKKPCVRLADDKTQDQHHTQNTGCLHGDVV